MPALIQTPEMERLGTRKISGGALRKLRFELALTQKELGERIGLSELRVRQIEKSIDAGVRPAVWRKLMTLTGKTLELVEADLAIPSPEEDMLDLDPNVETYSEVEVSEAPIIEMPLAAGPMLDVSEVEGLNDPLLLRARIVHIRIRGKSMEPIYKDGTIVEFKALKFFPEREADKLEVGADYYVQVAGQATFKRLVEIFDGELVFQAINKRKYPDKIKVGRNDDGVNMARALGIFTPAGELR